MIYPQSCEDLFYKFRVDNDNWQNIYPDGKTKTKKYCRNSKLVDGVKKRQEACTRTGDCKRQLGLECVNEKCECSNTK